MFWALYQRPPRAPYLRFEDMAQDHILLDALREDKEADTTLDRALDLAVRRGTILKVQPPGEESNQSLYFLNSARGRAAAEGLQSGAWSLDSDPELPIDLASERPNIFVLYEENIGPLTPMIAEELREAEETYPRSWIEDAVRIAVGNNVRKWTYVRAILEDWRVEGRDEREDRRDTEEDRRRYLESYKRFLES